MSEPLANIVGVGNVLMGDDGVGPAAIEAMRESSVDARAELLDAGLAFSEVLCDLEPDRPLVVLDAVRGGRAPGSIYRIELSDLTAETHAQAGVSLHEISVLPALRMEALAGRAFDDVTVFGVEPERVDWCQELSGPVSQAVEGLVQAVCHYLDQRAASAASSPGGRNEAPGSTDS